MPDHKTFIIMFITLSYCLISFEPTEYSCYAIHDIRETACNIRMLLLIIVLALHPICIVFMLNYANLHLALLSCVLKTVFQIVWPIVIAFLSFLTLVCYRILYIRLFWRFLRYLYFHASCYAKSLAF